MDIKRAYIDNLEINYLEIKDQKVTLLSMPQRLTVSLTTRCNLACRMCAVRKMTWELPQKTVKEVIRFFPYLRQIAWQGGEVFLFESFKEILEEASKYQNLIHEITTNGHFLDKGWIEAFNKINLNLCISIDSVNKNNYEYIRKGSKFKHLVRTLNLIKENKKKRDKRLDLSLVVTVMKSNYQELDQFVNFAKKYGFDQLFFQPIGGNFDNEENIFYNKDERALMQIERVKPKMKEKAREYGIMLYEWLPTKVNIKEPDKELDEARMRNSNGELFCLAPWQQLFIAWEGGIYSHCLCVQDEFSKRRKIGDVFKETLLAAWNNENMQLFRKKIIENDFLQLCCSNCVQGLVPDNLRSFRN